MADHPGAARRSRGCLTPVVGGLGLIAALIAGIAFRADLWRFAKWIGRMAGHLFTEWIPDHQGQSAAIAGFTVVAFAINWVAHVRGRLRAWIFALVVETGLWLLFWYSVGIPSLNELFGLDLAQLTPAAVAISGAVVIAVAGVLFWFLEAREEWQQYRRQHHVDGD